LLQGVGGNVRRPVLICTLVFVALSILAAFFCFDGWREFFAAQTGKPNKGGKTAVETKSSEPSGSAVAAPKPTMEELRDKARAVKANELGQVPILVYHLIADQA
jgi:hypothetical protein